MINIKYPKAIRISLIVIFLSCLINKVSAQQDPMFTQYMHNPVSINPAYAGSRGTMNVVAMHRQQWVGIDGSPKTLALSINSPFISYNVGVGLSLLYDQLGPTKQTGIYADYSYHLKVSYRSKLSFGIKGGLNMYDINLLGLRGSEGDDYISMYGSKKKYLPNFGVGAYYYSNRFYMGLSVPKLLQNDLSVGGNTLVSKEERHYFFATGVVLDVTENIKFKPSTTVRIVSGAPVSVELSAAVLLHDKLWLGGMYRNGDALGGMVKFDITNQLSLGYSYDYTLSELRPFNQGTHEVYISYDFVHRNRKTLSPRYF